MRASLTTYSAAFFLVILNFAHAQQQPQVTYAYSLGVGNLTCADWTSDTDFEFTTWVEGYWSGVNAMSSVIGSVGTVGQKIGTKSAVQAVHALCQASPASSLSLEASAAWVNARAAGQ